MVLIEAEVLDEEDSKAGKEEEVGDPGPEKPLQAGRSLALPLYHCVTLANLPHLSMLPLLSTKAIVRIR